MHLNATSFWIWYLILNSSITPSVLVMNLISTLYTSLTLQTKTYSLAEVWTLWVLSSFGLFCTFACNSLYNRYHMQKLCASRAISGAHECQYKLSQQSRLMHRLKAYLEQVLFDCRLRWDMCLCCLSEMSVSDGNSCVYELCIFNVIQWSDHYGECWFYCIPALYPVSNIYSIFRVWKMSL